MHIVERLDGIERKLIGDLSVWSVFLGALGRARCSALRISDHQSGGVRWPAAAFLRLSVRNAGALFLKNPEPNRSRAASVMSIHSRTSGCLYLRSTRFAPFVSKPISISGSNKGDSKADSTIGLSNRGPRCNTIWNSPLATRTISPSRTTPCSVSRLTHCVNLAFLSRG